MYGVFRFTWPYGHGRRRINVRNVELMQTMWCIAVILLFEYFHVKSISNKQYIYNLHIKIESRDLQFWYCYFKSLACICILKTYSLTKTVSFKCPCKSAEICWCGMYYRASVVRQCGVDFFASRWRQDFHDAVRMPLLNVNSRNTMLIRFI